MVHDYIVDIIGTANVYTEALISANSEQEAKRKAIEMLKESPDFTISNLSNVQVFAEVSKKE